ncbi:PAS domain S-box protein [Geopsychrobacter electrodiphilus]|uniref:PAS domain S-box protein n=1 Tax=Geopsychrobacter electrodiphilus TaxID=225196 RepID=UPI0003785B00|nr:PAS domain S-box protein [Geopsychrobacter electrodiphilus]
MSCLRMLCRIIFLLFMPLVAISPASVFAAENLVSTVQLTDAEHQWLKSHPTIILAPDPEFKPIEYIDKSGEYQGAAADIIRLLEKKLGIKITIAHLKNWDEAMTKFKNKEVDLLGAMVKTPNREKFATFTDTIVSVPGGIFTRSKTKSDLTLNDLKGKKVAVVSNYTAHDVLKAKYPDIILDVVPDVSTGLAKVSLGMVDAYVENMANATYYSQEAGITNLHLAGKTEFDYRWGIGIRKDWPELQGILNKGLASISKEERQQAIKRWIYIEGQQWRPSKNFIYGAVVSTFGILLLLAGFWNYALRKKVRNRTVLLQRELDERQRAESALQNLTSQLEERVREKTSELRASEENYRYISGLTSDFVHKCARTGSDPFRIQWVGGGIKAISGYSAEEVYEKGCWLPFVHSDDRKTVMSYLLSLTPGDRKTIEFRLISKQGETRWIAETCDCTRGEKEGELLLFGASRDITDRKRYEEELQMTRTSVEAASDAIFWIKPDGSIADVNPAACRSLGYTREELIQMSVADIDANTDADVLLQQFPELRKLGSMKFESEHCRKDGSVFPVEIATNYVQLEGEECNCAFVRDISERKQAENKYRMLFELSPIGMAMVDNETGEFLEVNNAVLRPSGYTREEFLKLSFWEITPQEYEAQELQQLRELAETGRFGPNKKEYIRKDGTKYPITISGVLFTDTNGRQVVWGIIEDITESVKAEEERLSLEKQLLYAQKLESLGVLAGGIAHDFNNILMAIIGNADLALKRINKESPAVENLHRIEQASERAADLAKQMLAYSGKGKFVIENIDLNILLEEMLHMLEVSISKKVVLRLNPYTPLPSVEADSTQMRQIVMNLVINASEAIGDKSGVIAITTGCMDCDRSYLKDVWLDENISEGLYVYLEIADTGCGMNKETLAKLFDPFFTTKFTGRGLGMAAVLGIVRGHKGAIKVYSEPNRGTTFKILLPACDRPVEIFNGASHYDDWKGEGTVLLVDDEETVRGIGAEMLKELGFTVITADDGREGVEQFKQNPDIDFVILDLTMPHMDGEQCFRELRQIKPDIKVIMSSGYNEQEVTQKFVGKGLAGFIQKPYKLSILRESIQKI